MKVLFPQVAIIRNLTRNSKEQEKGDEGGSSQKKAKNING